MNLKSKGRKSIPSDLINFGRHLVYSEGLKTEKNYIEEIKECIASKYRVNSSDIEIIFVSDKSYNTKSLVQYAFNDVECRIKKNEMIDHVWIFFDKDEFPLSHYNAAIEMIKSKNNSNDRNIDGFNYDSSTGITWHECHSNEAFELWYCLYFDYLNTSLTRKDYIMHLEAIEQLKKASFCYNKNEKGLHSLFTKYGGDINLAIKHAKKLEEINSYNNPSTSVYKFVEYFKPYFKQ